MGGGGKGKKRVRKWRRGQGMEWNVENQRGKEGGGKNREKNVWSFTDHTHFIPTQTRSSGLGGGQLVWWSNWGVLTSPPKYAKKHD